ncbi:hypothetical protein J7481_09530 [Labrenzia sp. R4_2]|uniref:hypothetical protein n=1 Tax=Labrenzia sp. R4_2 TaxID=2821107 RepID=UPI001ADA96A1|nr:hypothetical protein [Labrenzia sp. R4_2]MBO9419732.1 hypothetical protein [Labrenzia sp. R4_2]
MIAAIDNTFLTLLLNPAAKPRTNPATKIPATHCKERIEGLVDTIDKRGGRLLVPAPCLAEVLASDEATDAYITDLQSYGVIEIADFNARAAYELGHIIRNANFAGDKRSGEKGNWQHIKMDRQIVAIAKVHNVDTFYTDDQRQRNFAEAAGLKVLSTWDLDLPSKFAQMDMLKDHKDGQIGQAADRKIQGSSEETRL